MLPNYRCNINPVNTKDYRALLTPCYQIAGGRHRGRSPLHVGRDELRRRPRRIPARLDALRLRGETGPRLHADHAMRQGSGFKFMWLVMQMHLTCTVEREAGH